MDYKNFLLRSIVTLVFLSLFLYIIFNFSYYLRFIFFIIYLLIIWEVYKNFNIKFINKLFIFIYLCMSLIFLEIFLINYFDIYKFIYFVFIISIFDIFSYLIGSLFGKKKILPKISPGKSYIGLIGGILFSLIFSLTFIKIAPIYSINQIIFLSLSFNILSFFGDLFESHLKRISMIKDSSILIPGHGGFFDRFDSFVLCSYFILVTVYIL